jgi:hypothetical protein
LGPIAAITPRGTSSNAMPTRPPSGSIAPENGAVNLSWLSRFRSAISASDNSALPSACVPTTRSILAPCRITVRSVVSASSCESARFLIVGVIR